MPPEPMELAAESLMTSPAWQRSELPIFGTIASRFNDNGTTALYQYLRNSLVEHGLSVQSPVLAPAQSRTSTSSSPIVPSDRVRYLAEIGDAVRRYHAATQQQVKSVRRWTQVNSTLRLLREVSAISPSEPLAQLEEKLGKSVSPESRALLENLEQARTIYSQDELVEVRDCAGARTGGCTESPCSTRESRRYW